MTPKDLFDAQRDIESEGQRAIRAHRDTNLLPVSSTQPVVDTCQIMQIYLQRPQKLATLPFCLWFSGAHKLQDEDFKHCASQMDAKLQIVEKGYNRLSLEPLHQFNKSSER
jgi:hypothetical protein